MTSISLSKLVVQPASVADEPAVEALLDRTFGPGRVTKTAYRIREKAGVDPNLSFLAHAGGRLVGSVAFAPIRIGDLDARLLGPLAVEPEFANQGAGRALIDHGIRAAAEVCDLVVLVGDRDYYARSGFVPVPAGRIVFPGPVDPARILWRSLNDVPMDGVFGDLTPFPIPGRREEAEQGSQP